MSTGVGSISTFDDAFLDALVMEEYERAWALAALGGLKMLAAQRNHSLAEGYQ